MKKLFLLYIISFAFILVNNHAVAQQKYFGGRWGTIINNEKTDSIYFTATLSPTCSGMNSVSPEACGIALHDQSVLWSGNTNDSTSVITYNFSTPIISIDLLIAGTSVNGQMAPETFLFTTNSSIPTITVNSGTCDPWIIVGNQTTSPLIEGGINSIHTISSKTPFTTFTITTNSSGTGPGANGGSFFALCDASAILAPYSKNIPGEAESPDANSPK